MTTDLSGQKELYLGYVINIHDPTTFNISLEISSETMDKIAEGWWVHNNKVITSVYEYYDDPCQLENKKSCVTCSDNQNKGNHPEDKRPTITQLPLIKTDIVYRCRIKGVGVVRPMDIKMQKAFRKTYGDIKRQIDLQNGWVLVRIHHPDRYKRLLVDIYDPITKRDITQLFNFQDGVFHQYCNKISQTDQSKKLIPKRWNWRTTNLFGGKIKIGDRYSYHNRLSYND